MCAAGDRHTRGWPARSCCNPPVRTRAHPIAPCPATQTAGLLQRLFGIRFVYLVNLKPLGYGGANTQAIEAATGEYIVLANNDM